jgi:hypothetical protein
MLPVPVQGLSEVLRQPNTERRQKEVDSEHGRDGYRRLQGHDGHVDG